MLVNLTDDTIALRPAVLVAPGAPIITDIATGEVLEPQEAKFRKWASVAGSKGGPASSKALTPEQRLEIACLAAHP